MCQAPARPTPRSRDGGKTPSSRPLDGVRNFSPELNRPGEPGLTFQASEATAQPPWYGPQRGQPHGSRSPDLCRPDLHPHHTPHARPPHHPSVRKSCSGGALAPSVGGGAARKGFQLPLPVPTHSLKHLLAPARVGGRMSASSVSLNLPTRHLCAAPPFAGCVLVLQRDDTQVRKERSGSVPRA